MTQHEYIKQDLERLCSRVADMASDRDLIGYDEVSELLDEAMGRLENCRVVTPEERAEWAKQDADDAYVDERRAA